jgi:APA family basic amino acid/polyamine antiporter
MYLVPAQQTTSAAEFARRAGEAMLGARGPSVLAAVVVLSVLGSAMALLMMAPRLYVAMSRDRLFPPALAAVSPATGTPARATGVLAILATAYVLAGTFQQVVAFFLCTALCFVALAAAGLLVIRAREPGAPYHAPGFPLTPVLFVLLVATVVALVAIARPLQALAGFGLVLPGLAVYSFVSRRAHGLHDEHG